MGKQMTLRNMIFSPDATDAQIRATRKEVRRMQDEMEELNLEDLLAIRGVLTAEQKQRLPQIAPGQRGPRTANAGGPGGGKKRLSQNQRSAQK
jgi:Spy/CpxP family protein refolding chaperone